MTERLTSELAVIHSIERQGAEARHRRMINWGWIPVVPGVEYTMDANDFFEKKEKEILEADFYKDLHEDPKSLVEPMQSNSNTQRRYTSRYNHSQRS